jgi:LmbE family N-acetylglucosaminyl deacetylase
LKKKRSILSIFAHPDDESYGVGGALAKYHQEGVRLVLVTLTDGGNGSKRLQPGILPNAPLGECRLKELEMACQVLGVDRLITLGYTDGKLDQDNKEEIREKIVSIILEERPDIIITFHPNGISGHRDHIITAELAKEAFWQAAKSGNRSPHQAKKLYYQCMVDKVAAMLGRRYPGRNYYGLKLEEITTIIDTSDYTNIRLEALKCHQTQFSPGTYDRDAIAARFHKEFYQRYYPEPQPGELRETDLFDGIA